MLLPTVFTESERVAFFSVHRAGRTRHSSNPRGSAKNDAYSSEFQQKNGYTCTRQLRTFPLPIACTQAPRAV